MQRTLKLSRVKVNPNNPRTISQDKADKLLTSILQFPKMLSLRPIVIDADNISLGGNMRLYQLNRILELDDEELDFYLGGKLDELRPMWEEIRATQKIPSAWIKKASELSDKEKEEFIIKDNIGFGAWDWEAIDSGWNKEEVVSWGLDVPSWDLNSEGEVDLPEKKDNPYTRAIEAPAYTPTLEEPPPITELMNPDRYKALLLEIDNSTLPEEEKDFLRVAASRHIVFSYDKIAEYYAHASKELQELMEDSALVIIDFSRAIELGFTQLSEEIAKQFTKDQDYDKD